MAVLLDESSAAILDELLTDLYDEAGFPAVTGADTGTGADSAVFAAVLPPAPQLGGTAASSNNYGGSVR